MSLFFISSAGWILAAFFAVCFHTFGVYAFPGSSFVLDFFLGFLLTEICFFLAWAFEQPALFFYALPFLLFVLMSGVYLTCGGILWIKPFLLVISLGIYLTLPVETTLLAFLTSLLSIFWLPLDFVFIPVTFLYNWFLVIKYLKYNYHYRRTEIVYLDNQKRFDHQNLLLEGLSLKTKKGTKITWALKKVTLKKSRWSVLNKNQKKPKNFF